MDKAIKISCDIFVVKEGKLLLGIRKNTYGAGDWGLPGGHLEWGEKLTDCAIRELKEETSINATKLKLITVVDDTREAEHYLHFAFLAEKYKGEPQLIEPEKCEKWEFQDLNNLPKNLFWPHVQLIENLKSQTLYSG